MRFTPTRVLVLGLLAAACGTAWLAGGGPPAARALDGFSDWEGSWFRLKAKEKLYGASPEGLFKEKLRAPLYLLLESYDPGDAALGDERFLCDAVFFEDDLGDWETFPLELRVLSAPAGPDDLLVWSVREEGVVGAGEGMYLSFTARVKGRTRQDGSLKKGLFKSIGGVVVETEPPESWVGTLRLKGGTIDPAKLPFDPAIVD